MNRWSIMVIFPLTRKMHELQSRPVCKSLSYKLRSTYVTFKFGNISKAQPLQYTESRTKWLVPCRWHIHMRFKTNVFIAISLNFVLKDHCAGLYCCNLINSCRFVRYITRIIRGRVICIWAIVPEEIATTPGTSAPVPVKQTWWLWINRSRIVCIILGMHSLVRGPHSLYDFFFILNSSWRHRMETFSA